MPEELKKYFWDTQFELLDKEKKGDTLYQGYIATVI